ncbi:MAG TPA: nitrophenyl compound nitroreductase subunit ArsF family protein [bacterium]|nr:nitrophenyl compound nitroreductase subunit ArsF family protein [bacterium]HOL96053.1 nitrophenyl compound nitroreductase subunit ArsF family protein [bacterium]HPP03061.1 nitrophenyl compound nitroreductase subunit ArsF family protein [bacterium]HXK95800.1 nitrophenyl compound nitroreductase subunit ArsF family protein [bacterium]
MFPKKETRRINARTGMQRHRILLFLGLGLLLAGLFSYDQFQENKSFPDLAPIAHVDQVSLFPPGKESSCQWVVYYFHRTVRCPTCLKIEMLTSQTVQEHFSDFLQEGILEWHVINMEEPRYQHFVNDFQLTAPSVILAKIQNGQTIQWETVEEVWNYAETPDSFSDFLKEKIEKYFTPNSYRE